MDRGIIFFAVKERVATLININHNQSIMAQFKAKKVFLEFEIGETSCITGDNRQCRFLSTIRFGSIFVCSLFNEEIHDQYELPRCKKCLKEFG